MSDHVRNSAARDQVALPVAWFEVTGKSGKSLRKFYEELFGWQTADVAPGADYGVTDSAPHGIGGGIGKDPTGKGGHVTFFVEVPDFESALREVERLGGKRVGEPLRFPDKRPSAKGRGDVAFAYFLDPEGHLVGLCQRIVRA
jgi:predicted enzyme related to lactoylglutathione lyase